MLNTYLKRAFFKHNGAMEMEAETIKNAAGPKSHTNRINQQLSDKEQTLNRIPVQKVLTVTCILIMLVTALIFHSCKKDEVTNEVKNHKVIDGEEDLRSFEYYTPNKETIREKLLSFTNYVNNPEEYQSAEIELKEAIWLMETFFNIGVCEKQKQFVDYSHSRKSYSFSLHFEGTSYEKIIFKEGYIHKYNDVLIRIIKDICPEYALNFGDVYVKSIDFGTRTIEIGIDILYGNKAAGTYKAIGRKKIIQKNQTVIYPQWAPKIDPNCFFNGGVQWHSDNYNIDDDIWVTKLPRLSFSKYTRDQFMECILNPNRTHDLITNVIHYKKFAETDRFAVYDTMVMTATKRYPFLESDYVPYGAKYRDYIYDKLCDSIPQYYSPFLAGCFCLLDHIVSMDCYDIVWHSSGLEYICMFNSFENFALTSFYVEKICYNMSEVNCYFK